MAPLFMGQPQWVKRLTVRQLKHMKLGRLVGKGSSGRVYEGTKKKSVFAVKLVQLNQPSCKGDFQMEMLLSEVLSSIGVGPRFRCGWVSRQNAKFPAVGVLVTDMWTMTLEDYLREHARLPQHLCKKLQGQLQDMHDVQFVHMDIHEANVLVKTDDQGKAVDVTLTDFERAMFLEEIDMEAVERTKKAEGVPPRITEPTEIDKWMLREALKKGVKK